MKFGRKKAPNKNENDLVKPLLSNYQFQQPLFQEYEYGNTTATPATQHPTTGTTKKLFPPKQKRRSAIIRQSARRKSEIKRFFGEDGMLSDDSDYTRFSFSSIGSTSKTATLRTLTLGSIEEGEERSHSTVGMEEDGKEDRGRHHTLWMVFKMTLVLVISAASVGFYTVAFIEELAVESSVVSLTFLAVAGGIIMIMAPWVCAKEWRLAKSPGELIVCWLIQYELQDTFNIHYIIRYKKLHQCLKGRSKSAGKRD